MCADELRTYWFEIFECFRKMALVCLPVFVGPGSPGQLILGLVICFITYGLYCVYAPYEDAGDDVLAQVAQMSIFFSLCASIVTNAYPDECAAHTLPAFANAASASRDSMIASTAQRAACADGSTPR